MAIAFTTASVALGAGAASIEAARQPTFKEREALTQALPSWIRGYPVGCVYLRMSIANDGRYALVEPAFLNAKRAPCLRYASNGYWILKKQAKWKIVFDGSDPPPCSLGVPPDLTKCVR